MRDDTAGSQVDSDERLTIPTFRDALRTWIYIGLNSFGGPAGQIAVMHRVLVDEKRWVGEKRFLHALNFCMLLPGPEAQQLATYIGWLFHGWRGGLVAGTLFVLPGAAVILALSILYAGFHDVSAVEAIFYGLKCAVLAIVVEAVLRIGKRALKTRMSYAIAGVAFVAIYFFAVPFPVIVAAAAIAGLATHILRPSGAHANVGRFIRPSRMRTAGVLALGLALWFTPLVALAAALGPGSVYFKIGEFFSKAAVVTFGGAYSVLAYVAQEAVATYAWLQPGEMLDGLAMAETTPGPLIMVVQFVGFMAAYRDPGSIPPMLAGTLGALLTTWVTFVPCFLWIFLGAPYVEALRGNRAISAALGAITSAVVGVVLNLAVWFGMHTLFAEQSTQTFGPLRLVVPTLSSVDLGSLLLTVAAAIATFKYHVGMVKVLAACAAGGVVLKWVLG